MIAVSVGDVAMVALLLSHPKLDKDKTNSVSGAAVFARHTLIAHSHFSSQHVSSALDLARMEGNKVIEMLLTTHR